MNRVKELCKKKGLSQKELAIIAGVSQPTVSDWFNGKKNPRDERLKKLSEIFDVSEAVILGYDSYIPLVEMSEKEREIYEALKQLPDEKLDQVLEYAKFLTENTNKKKENGYGA